MDMVNRGVISKNPEEELKAYSGPVNYITHHEVYKEGSTSTPVRLVSNSLYKNGETSLNELIAKGPNTRADIFDNLIKFRSYEAMTSLKPTTQLKQVSWRDIVEG